MSYKTDVFVRSDKLQTVSSLLEYTCGIFEVDIQLVDGTAGRQFMAYDGQWLDIRGSREHAIKAREYLKAISTPEEIVRLRFPPSLRAKLVGEKDERRTELAKSTCVHIVFPVEDEVEVSGSILAVTKIASEFEEIVRQAPSSFPSDDSKSAREANPELISPSNLCCSERLSVSSTGSTRDSAIASGSSCANLSDGFESSEERRAWTNGRSDEDLIEFALKLGYNQNEVRSALRKLGGTTNENGLLHELIKASSSAKQIGRPVVEDRSSLIRAAHTKVSENSQLRHIVIDGSNVAMSHGNHKSFSSYGIAIAVDWFLSRGHAVRVFVPSWRKDPPKADYLITDQYILHDLEQRNLLTFTPSRRIDGRLVQCYDDRYIVKYAVEQDGVIVSNDNFRDLQRENPELKDFIERRLLMYSFVNDKFMPPDDPLGRNGPTLDELLRRNSDPRGSKVCPYGRKCTYGAKCKFYHPERSVNTSAPKSRQYRSSAAAPTASTENRPRSDPGKHPSVDWDDDPRRPISLPNLEQLHISATGYAYSRHAAAVGQKAVPGRPVSDPSSLEQCNYYQLGLQLMNAGYRFESALTDSITVGANRASVKLVTSTHYAPAVDRVATIQEELAFGMVESCNQHNPGEDLCYCASNGSLSSAEFPNHYGYSSMMQYPSYPTAHSEGSLQPPASSVQPYRTPSLGLLPAVPPSPDRTSQSRLHLVERLHAMFPDHYDKILSVVRNHLETQDLALLTRYLYEE